jgi:hypothetical protein
VIAGPQLSGRRSRRGGRKAASRRGLLMMLASYNGPMTITTSAVNTLAHRPAACRRSGSRRGSRSASARRARARLSAREHRGGLRILAPHIGVDTYAVGERAGPRRVGIERRGADITFTPTRPAGRSSAGRCRRWEPGPCWSGLCEARPYLQRPWRRPTPDRRGAASAGDRFGVPRSALGGCA